MKVKSSEYVISAVGPEQWPTDGLPEIALSGRSNVGKSSLINHLLNRKNLARTSQKPGKTQKINYFIINEAFYFVDVPGYGYAQVSQKERQAWGRMMEQYFAENKQLRVVVALVDFRHPPTNDDIQMYQFLKYHEIPVIVVATKCDKVPKTKRPKQQKIIKGKLDLHPEDTFIVFSSQEGIGKDALWKAIEAYL
ncbi:GTP-binding protein [Pullulanibacillus pueri]|uniref:Probable GTP-binding protein EngB n=1 Tax=Pullulanibacillus pueri TaxID=1437324 RepID=A0A8J2ZWV6_9BACL|nr:ribosome biogenesis GTP-binding protein YihA/YsxC [Pullulanibacillus pueri]MBM7681909.1 GTP-binding protein [Pullulanibacillus pueri]GGH83405.1 putative GTP-binding protein EngB [Pullulanibacillus pueri]